MKKGELLHPQISAIVAKAGHGDMLTIADAGLPIAETVTRIDLALRRGMPPFVDVLTTILAELQVEQVTLAQEIKAHNPALLTRVERILSDNEIASIAFVTHREFKILTRETRAVVRSGECQPFANILLHCGVTF